MSFGLEVFDESGNNTLSITDETMMLVEVKTLNLYYAGQRAVTRTYDYSSLGSKIAIFRSQKSGYWAHADLSVSGGILYVRFLGYDTAGDRNTTLSVTFGVFI